MTQKKQTKLEKEISEIIIVNNKKLDPYIEIVNFSSRNIDQKKLGTILGIFEIKDISDDSAYIVNFLASVSKKNYFASHQKTPNESFESTLAKLNLSLSEIAKHGNVNWIGKIDAVLCSISENHINFSVSGDAKVLLLRNNKLMEISGNLSPKDETINPLKTFTDIASGKLDSDDKLILTTDDISHIFSIEDLEKHALSFPNKKFIRFLKTALVNELDIAGTLVVDFKEKIITEKTIPTKLKKSETQLDLDYTANVFSNTPFTKEPSASKNDLTQENIEENLPNKDYTNKKTGHIYISDDESAYEDFQDNKINNFFITLGEKFSELGIWFKEKYFKKNIYRAKKTFSNLLNKRDYSREISDITLSSKLKNYSQLFFSWLSKFLKKTAQLILNLASTFWIFIKKNYTKFRLFLEKKYLSKSFIKKNSSNNLIHNNSVPQKKERFLVTIKSERRQITKIINKIKLFIKKIIPKLSLLKYYFLKMSLPLKLFTLLIIALIFILPFFLLSGKNKKISTTNQTNSDNFSDNLNINPSSEFYREAETLYTEKNLLGAIVSGNIIFNISQDKITTLDESGSKRDYSYPSDFREVRFFSFMYDLNLLFLINSSNKLISFSPVSLKFKDESILIDDTSKIEGIDSYLTYLYVIDSANNQIYRYPRADGGFGEKINWLQSTLDLKEVTGIAIDGNLFVAKKESVSKLFNRKSQDFQLKRDSNSSVNGIFTNESMSSIYILDNLNGELDRFDKNGNKEGFVSNQNLSQASSLWIDEKNSIAYFVANDTLFKIVLPE